MISREKDGGGVDGGDVEGGETMLIGEGEGDADQMADEVRSIHRGLQPSANAALVANVVNTRGLQPSVIASLLQMWTYLGSSSDR